MAWNTEAYQRYRKSKKGKETRKRYHRSGGYKAISDKYAKSAKGQSARKKYRDLWYKTERGRKYSMYYAAKRRAKRKGIEFRITQDDIHFPEVCPLLDIPIKISAFGIRHDSPSLDRKDSSKGYTPENVWVVSTRANILKNNASIEELDTLVSNLKRHLCGSIYA